MKTKDFEIQHSGKHHLAKISSKKGIVEGRLSNFGERGVATLTLRKGKVFGEIAHSSDNHSASFILKQDGTWKGEYTNGWNDKSLTLALSKGKVQASDIDLSLEHKGKNHNLFIAVDKKGDFSGSIMRKARNMKLELEGQSRGHVSGSIGHTGKHHDLDIILNKNGTWTAKGKVKTKAGMLSVSVSKGEAKVGFGASF